MGLDELLRRGKMKNEFMEAGKIIRIVFYLFTYMIFATVEKLDQPFSDIQFSSASVTNAE